jgi:hypothetical protein
MLGPANRENKTLKDIRDVANPRPVAMYLAPPNVKLLRMECVYICVEKTSNTNDSEISCFVRRTTARKVPRSTNSIKKMRQSGGRYDNKTTRLEGTVAGMRSRTPTRYSKCNVESSQWRELSYCNLLVAPQCTVLESYTGRSGVQTRECPRIPLRFNR